ncbi:hypothetical protein WBG78_23060 [Chryseolinea sp. T2]|uniref:hypothetical protein n=1 Tax=Chryseolinea sp. T2 TaxID=3129255 RepID=UPI0030772680
MNEIIDTQRNVQAKFLKRSAKLYKIYGGLIVFAIIVSIFIRPYLLLNYSALTDLVDLLVGLPILSLFVLAPLGLYYSWKSYKENEGHRKLRVKYTIGHVFFCILMLLFLGVFISDISFLLE